MHGAEPGGRPTQRDERRAERRAEMVQAAMEAVRRHGAGVSVAEIAATAGITKPVLYRHFTDRADLQQAVGERAAALLMARIAAVRGPGTGDARLLVRGIVDAFLTTIEDERELWRFVVHHPVERTAGVTDDAGQHIAAPLATLIGDRRRELGLDPGGAEAMAHGLVGMVQRAGDWWLERRTMSRAELSEHLTQIIWGGLASVLALPPSDAPLLRVAAIPEPRRSAGGG